MHNLTSFLFFFKDIKQTFLTVRETKLVGNVCVRMALFLSNKTQCINFKQVFSFSNEFLSHRELNLSIPETKLLQKPGGDISL